MNRLRPLLLVLVAIPACGEKTAGPVPPVANRILHVATRHGTEVTDPYHWLRDRDDPAVLAHLEAENAYAEAVMAPAKALRETLYEEILGRIRETDLSVPEKRDEYFYYTRTEEGRPYRIHCRKKGSLDATEEILLDVNDLAEGHDYCAVAVVRPDPSHRILAYSVDYAGSELYALRFKDLTTGELLPEEIGGTFYSVEWAEAGDTVFYTTLNDAHRPWRLCRHVLGTDPADDVVVHEEPDEKFYVSIGKTRSREHLVLSIESQVTTEVLTIPASEPTAEFRVLVPRRPGVEARVAHHGDRFFVLTNDAALNFALFEVPETDPARERWILRIPHREDVKLDRVDLFERYMVVTRRQGGVRRLAVVDLRTDAKHEIEMPEPVYSVWPRPNPEFGATRFRFTYSSPVTPRSVVEYDLATRERKVLKEDPVEGYDRERFAVERIWAKAPDGVEVPITLAYRKGVERDGSNPLVLAAYGAYGASADPGFSASRISLLERGVIRGIAHVRGGGDLGRGWYEDGKLFRKRNTMTDFIACAEHLIETGWTSRSRLAIRGQSAGGLTIGAVLNQRPDLFRAAVADVPFVDVVNTMLDASLPLTAGEWEEWGDPRRKADYDYMMTYSPYDNVRDQEYPELLVTAGLADPRVGFWEPAKWVARLRARNTGKSRILLRTNLGAGHGGASGRYGRIRETAFEYAFVLRVLGVEK